MVSLDDAVVARLARFGTTFEILVDPEESEHWVNGDQPDTDVTEILAVDDVFVDWSEGERAPKDKLQEAFETTDVAVIARRILDEGEIQLTQDQRKRMLESKHKRIIATIAREAWNPQTKNPHPVDRIERALTEAKWRADPLRRVEDQVHEAMKRLKP
ncbi:MAG: ribosome assembly factor SBDS, partial [Thermoplasmatota archaeon]